MRVNDVTEVAGCRPEDFIRLDHINGCRLCHETESGLSLIGVVILFGQSVETLHNHDV